MSLQEGAISHHLFPRWRHVAAPGHREIVKRGTFSMVADRLIVAWEGSCGQQLTQNCHDSVGWYRIYLVRCTRVKVRLFGGGNYLGRDKVVEG